MISNEEWNALPEEEKERRRNEMLEALREMFKGWDKEVVKVALESTIKDLKKEANNDKAGT